MIRILCFALCLVFAGTAFAQEKIVFQDWDIYHAHRDKQGGKWELSYVRSVHAESATAAEIAAQIGFTKGDKKNRLVALPAEKNRPQWDVVIVRRNDPTFKERPYVVEFKERLSAKSEENAMEVAKTKWGDQGKVVLFAVDERFPFLPQDFSKALNEQE